MKLHIITVCEPKLAYAKTGWAEYIKRLQHYHTVHVTHIADKHAYDADYLLQTATGYKVALVIDGPQKTSEELAAWMEKRAMDGRETCLLVGGPEGLPQKVVAAADMQLGLSR